LTLLNFGCPGDNVFFSLWLMKPPHCFAVYINQAQAQLDPVAIAVILLLRMTS